MKVLFISPPAKDHPVVRDMAGGLGFDGGPLTALPPLEFAYMAATLLNKGHEAKIIDSDIEGYDYLAICQHINEFQPDSIIVNVSLPTLYQDCSFLKRVCEKFSLPLIVKTGIMYPPLLKEILERSTANLCIYGESDLQIEEIILGKEKIGTAYFENDEFRMEKESVVSDLDQLPLPARNLLSNEKYRYELLGDKVTVMQTSRGCPFPCSYYCAYPMVQGSNWRARTPVHVVREIEDIVHNHQIKKILFRDATFTLKKQRTEQICDLVIQKNIKIEWWCETRVDCLDRALMKKMKDAGCLGMNIGVETGDPEVMETKAKIGLTMDKLISVRDWAQQIGLRLHFLLMLGLPEETKQSIYKTHKLLCGLKPKTMGVCIVTPYPGTQLYKEAKQKGWIESEDWSRYGGHYPVMHTDDVSADDLMKARRMMQLGFYFLKKRFTGRLGLFLLDYYFKRWINR